MPPANSVRIIWVIKDEYLPTNHGFDEFYGNLYHLNAEQEPEMPYWPKDDPYTLNSPRVFSRASDDQSTHEPHWTVGKVEDTGPLTINAWRRSTTRRPPPRSTS